MQIGLLIGAYNSSYSLSIIRWISRELESKDCSLVTFEGYSLNNNSISDYQCNTLYRLISRERIDGLIILSSELAVQTGKELVTDLAARIALPVVSLGIYLDGVPSVLLDNSSGFEKIVSHLVSHKYTKFAHISGPFKNPESMIRRDAFLKVIYQNGFELPKHFILEGSFNYNSGYNLTKKLIPYVKSKEIEAIVCANDRMAFGAAKCLYENGITVPDDVAITGFDDSGISHHFLPPITTVAQCFDKLCSKAVSLILDPKYGEKDAQVFTFEPQLIIRNSCGCTESVQPLSSDYNIPIIHHYKINGRLQGLETENFFSVVMDYLQENSINNCYIVRFMESVRFDDFSGLKQFLKCRLFFGYSNGKRVYYTKPFDANQILPDSIYETRDASVIIKHLFFGKIQFGFVVISACENASSFIDDLVSEINHYLENIHLAQEKQITEKKLSVTLESLILTNRKLNEMTVKENLDKLNNLRYLANNMLQNRKSGNGDYYLILVEIDNFLEINNKYGFDEGEALINNISQILASSIRDDDFLSHQNCERYVILVKNIHSSIIETIEKRFKSKLNELNANNYRPYLIGFTWGYAYARIDSNFDSIYEEAELNLVMQKKFKAQIIKGNKQE